jgi:CBS domain containing-hemolysin-like protein
MDLGQRPDGSPLQAGGFHTLGGFAMHRLGRIPRAGERFACDGLLFEIVDMDGNRVDKLLVRCESEPEQPGPGDPGPSGPGGR